MPFGSIVETFREPRSSQWPVKWTLTRLPSVRDAVEAAIAPGARVIVDLREVSFLDSTGLGVFVTALKHVREADGTLDLVVTSARVLKVFELTGLDVVIPIHEELGPLLDS